jgi:hypothetical protein
MVCEGAPDLKTNKNAVVFSPDWKYPDDSGVPSTMMINPVLLENVRKLGPTLQETGVEALGLEGTSVNKLKTARIFTVEQLASSDEATLLHIPHFGIGKVERIRACLNSYLATILEGYLPAITETGELPGLGVHKPLKRGKKSSRLSSKVNSNLPDESLYERLHDLEKRIGFLESKLARIRETRS